MLTFLAVISISLLFDYTILTHTTTLLKGALLTSFSNAAQVYAGAGFQGNLQRQGRLLFKPDAVKITLSFLVYCQLKLFSLLLFKKGKLWWR